MNDEEREEKFNQIMEDLEARDTEVEAEVLLVAEELNIEEEEAAAMVATWHEEEDEDYSDL